MQRLLAALVFASMLLFLVSSAPAQKGRDLSKLRPCEIVTGADVAGIAKGKLVSPPTSGSTACAYLVELPDGKVESYRLFLQTAEIMTTMFRALTPAERGESVPGLWDEAYVGKQEMGTGLHLLALRRGDMAIEVTGERKDVLIAIARLAGSRLK